jgi:hypothetical protein
MVVIEEDLVCDGYSCRVCARVIYEKSISRHDSIAGANRAGTLELIFLVTGIIA